MFGHGYSVLFLASVCTQEKDRVRRRKIEDVLSRAIGFTAKAQTKAGGWGYVSAAEGNDFDEGAATITQIQSLRAARLAGIPVPQETWREAQEYLKKSTTANGGVIYSLKSGPQTERPVLTVAALVALFSPPEYENPLAKKWIQYIHKTLPVGPLGKFSMGQDAFTQYYLAQAAYGLGDGGYAQIFPEAKPAERLTWSDYRKKTFEDIVSKQSANGSWKPDYIGSVYSTACMLTILQLEKGTLPIYQRPSAKAVTITLPARFIIRMDVQDKPQVPEPGFKVIQLPGGGVQVIIGEKGEAKKGADEGTPEAVRKRLEDRAIQELRTQVQDLHQQVEEIRRVLNKMTEQKKPY